MQENRVETLLKAARERLGKARRAAECPSGDRKDSVTGVLDQVQEAIAALLEIYERGVEGQRTSTANGVALRLPPQSTTSPRRVAFWPSRRQACRNLEKFAEFVQRVCFNNCPYTPRL
jgi:hypothetical protein